MNKVPFRLRAPVLLLGCVLCISSTVKHDLEQFQSVLRRSAGLLHRGVTDAPDPAALRAAVAALEQLPRLNEDDRRQRQLMASAFNNRGVAYWALGRNDKALDVLTRAAEFDRFDDVALRNRAWVLQATPGKGNEIQANIEAAYMPLMELALIRLILHLSGGECQSGAGRRKVFGEAHSYAWLQYNLLRHLGVVEFERSSVPGAISRIEVQRYQLVFSLLFAHVGDGTVRMRCKSVKCASESEPHSTEGRKDIPCERVTSATVASRPAYEINIAELGLGLQLCADPADVDATRCTDSTSAQGDKNGDEGTGVCATPRACNNYVTTAAQLQLLKRSLTSLFDSQYATMASSDVTPFRSTDPRLKHWAIALAMPRLANLSTAAISFDGIPGSTLSSIGMLNHAQAAVRHVVHRRVPGDIIETGVWRGGLTVLLHAALLAYESDSYRTSTPKGTRMVWAADSFAGVPPPRDRSTFAADETHGWTAHLYAATLPSVRQRFELFGQLDNRIGFIKGFFNVSLPAALTPRRPDEPPPAMDGDGTHVGGSRGVLAQRRLAVLRLDGDTFESTMDVLLAAYARVSVGGVVIIDDFHLNGCRRAVFQFRASRGIKDPILPVPEDYIFGCSQRAQPRAATCAGARGNVAATTAPVVHAEPRKPVQGAYWVVGSGGW